MTSDQTALLAVIEAQPDDRTARLVYCDWLDENGFPEEAALHRALVGGSTELTLSRTEFEASVIAQDDDDDYQESGYVAGVLTRAGIRIAFLAAYGHCSCYGTWDDLTGDGMGGGYGQEDRLRPVKFTWVGPPAELVRMAGEDLDPCLTGRKIADADSDANHLRSVYAQVLKWAETHPAVIPPPPSIAPPA